MPSAKAGRSGPGSSVELVANHYSLSLGQGEVHVFQYALTVIPDEVFEAALVHECLNLKSNRLVRLLGGPFVPSGKMIFTMEPIKETVTVETSFKGQRCEIIIDKASETQTLLNAEFIND